MKKGYNCGLKISSNLGAISLWGFSGYAFNNQYYYFDESDNSKRMKKNIDNSWLFKLGVNAKF